MKKLLGLLAMAPMAVAACGGSASAGSLEGDINVYTRDSSSGTREGFIKAIDGGEADGDNSFLVSDIQEVTGSGDMELKVAADKNGIGYTGLTALPKDGLKGLEFNGVEATTANVLNDTYKMSRDFSYTTIKTGAEGTASADELAATDLFNYFLTTVEGQQTVIDSGVIIDADSTIDWDTNQCISNPATVLVGGSTSVEKAAKAVTDKLTSLCGNFTATHAHTGSSSSEIVGTAGQNGMHIGFSSSGQRTGWQAGTVQADLGQDAIVAIVHEDNPLNNITEVQLQEIYIKHDSAHEGGATHTKNITKWSDLA